MVTYFTLINLHILTTYPTLSTQNKGSTVFLRASSYSSAQAFQARTHTEHINGKGIRLGTCAVSLTLRVLVTTIDALQHFETGY